MALAALALVVFDAYDSYPNMFSLHPKQNILETRGKALLSGLFLILEYYSSLKRIERLEIRGKPFTTDVF